MIEPSSDLPDFINRVIRFRRDYEALCRDIVGEKSRALTSGRRGPALTEATVADDPEPDDKAKPPISDAEAYRLQDRVNREVNTLADMGIYSTSRWRIAAKCRYHGEQSITLDTNEEIPDNSYLRCFGCLSIDKVRWLEITEKKRLEEGE